MIDALLIGLTAMLPKKNPPPDDRDHYYEAELTPKQREAILRMCEEKQKGIPVVALEAIKSAVLDARRIEGRLPRARLDWKEIEAEAKRQGCDVVDIIFDRRGGT